MHKFFKKACAVAMAAILMLSIPLATFANQPTTAVREFFEGEGAVINWYEPLRRITINLAGTEAQLYIGEVTVYMNNVPVTRMENPVVLVGGVSRMLLEDAQGLLELLLAPPHIYPALTQPPARPPVSFAAPVTDHGTIALGFLEFIEANLYNRIAYTLRERETAEWIAQELINMGHDPANVYIQQFPITGWVMDTIPILKALSDAGDYLDQIPSEFRPLLSSLNIYTMEDILAHTFLPYSQNVILTVPGVSERRIIVGAHYDSPNSPGISDNASGTVTLMESAQRILDLEHYYTITYIFFGAEEVGLVGAFYYAESLSYEDIANIALMINIDVIFDGFGLTFGAGYFCLETFSRASNHATQALLDIANALNAEYALGLIHEIYGIGMSSDQLAFLPLGVQILTFYSMNNWNPTRANLDMLLAIFSGEPQEPLLSVTRLELVLAMLDGTDDEAVLSAIEADREMLEFLMAGLAMESRDFIAELVDTLLELIADVDDEEFTALVNAELAMLELALQILDHPEFVFAGPVEYNTGSIGLVLHTLNDNLTYLNENFPGLVERALNAYSLFLEKVLTLPAGSLE